MEQKDIGGLVSLVFAAGWRPKLNDVLGTDTSVFYDALVVQDPERAYAVAQQSEDPVFLQAVTERIIKNTVGGSDIESAIREMYLSPVAPVVPGEP